TIAFEMAQQLLADGQCVDVLALLDAMVIHDEGFAAALETQGEDDEADLIAKFLEESSPISAGYLRQLGPDEMLTYALDQAKRAALLPPDFEVAQLRRLLNVHRANLHAWAIDYVPQFYNGRIVLFRATEEERTDLTLGWGRLAGEGVQIHDVPGRHVSMIKEPHVKTLAARLREVLDGAENGISAAISSGSKDRPRAFATTSYAERSNPDLF